MTLSLPLSSIWVDVTPTAELEASMRLRKHLFQSGATSIGAHVITFFSY